MHPILSRNLFLLTQRLSGADLGRRLAELEESQYMPRQDMDELQWRRLRDLLQHAYTHVPYYRRTWDEHGIRLSRIQSIEDLRVLPCLTKADVQQHYEELLSPTRKDHRLHHGKTSGTSGNPMLFLRTQDSKARFWAAQYRAYGWFGIRIGDRQGRFYGMPFAQAQSRKEKIKDFVMNRSRLLGVFDLGDERLEAFAEAMNRFRPVYFNGYSSWLGRFAEFMSAHDVSRYNWIPLKGVVTTSEILTDRHKQLIEETFGCRVINEYGAAEIGLVAISCPHGGFHTVPENTVLEQLPSRDLEAMEAGGTRYREVVVTDLHSHAMPFIRYQVDDYLQELPDDDATCPCGRTSRLVGAVQGRTNQYILTPEGAVRGGMVFDYIFKLSAVDNLGVRAACARQIDLHTFVMYVVRDVGYSDRFIAFVNEIVTKHVSPAMRVEFEFVDELPRSPTGKVKLFSTDLDVDAERQRLREPAAVVGRSSGSA